MENVTSEAKRLASIYAAVDADEDLIWLNLEEHDLVESGAMEHEKLFNLVMRYS
jgi:hypothetical protein